MGIGEYGMIAVVAAVLVVLRGYTRNEKTNEDEVLKDKEGYRINERGGTILDEDRLSSSRTEKGENEPFRSRED